MEKLRSYLNLEKEQLSITKFLVLVLIAYSFSVAIRFIWIYQFSGEAEFYWNNQIMINTNDGYFFAEGARDIIRGEKHYISSPTEEPISVLSAFLYKILPISFESLILYMPTFLGSLLVIPIMLLGRVLKLELAGFIGAMLGGIAWSYYNRTMTGYYDTDIFVVTLPAMFVVLTIIGIIKKDIKYLLLAPLFATLSINWHNGGYQIANGVLVATLIYTIIFERKSIFNYLLIAFFTIGLLNLALLPKLGILIVAFAIYFVIKDKIPQKALIAFIAILFAIYLFFGGFAWIMSILSNAYIIRALNADELNMSLRFYDVVGTVREAGNIPFDMFANRISGSIWVFIISVVGYGMLLVRYPVLIITLPMVGLGFFALKGGLRFTVFAVPFIALGTGFFIFFIAKYIQNIFSEKVREYGNYGIGFVGMVLVLYPNVAHVVDYKVPVVFTKSEVAVLDKLKSVAKRDDYVVTWWDYGYPIRYYSDVNTLIDGGKHDGGSNFAPSFVLTNNQIAGANLARLDVEYEQKFKKENILPQGKLLKMVKEHGFNDINSFFNDINSKDFQPKLDKTVDVFLFLPFKMLEIFPTVALFSNIDLTTGAQKFNPFFYLSQGFADRGEYIDLGGGIAIFKQGGTIQLGQQKLQLNSFITTAYNPKTGELQKNVQTINPQSPISVIYMQSYNKFLVVDNYFLNSTFIQLFVLENFDKDLYEPVIFSPLIKVYKLKR